MHDKFLFFAPRYLTIARDYVFLATHKEPQLQLFITPPCFFRLNCRKRRCSDCSPQALWLQVASCESSEEESSRESNVRTVFGLSAVGIGSILRSRSSKAAFNERAWGTARKGDSRIARLLVPSAKIRYTHSRRGVSVHSSNHSPYFEPSL